MQSNVMQRARGEHSNIIIHGKDVPSPHFTFVFTCRHFPTKSHFQESAQSAFCRVPRKMQRRQGWKTERSMRTKKPTSPSISPWSSCSSLPTTSPPLHLLRLQTCRAHRRATLLTRPPRERVAISIVSLWGFVARGIWTLEIHLVQLHLREIHQLCGSGKKTHRA